MHMRKCNVSHFMEGIEPKSYPFLFRVLYFIVFPIANIFAPLATIQGYICRLQSFQNKIYKRFSPPYLVEQNFLSTMQNSFATFEDF